MLTNNYGVGAVVSALSVIDNGRSLGDFWVQNSIDWLTSCQNEDGGFGESTLSYSDKDWIGKGISTPTQTAWSILALLEAERSGHLVTGSIHLRFVNNFLIIQYFFSSRKSRKSGRIFSRIIFIRKGTLV